jgi:UDP-glucose 4-epimerase
VFNVGEAEPPTAAERIRALGDAVGWSGAVCPVPAENLPESLTVPGDWRYELATDTRQIRDVLGHQAPVSFAEALRRTAAWERTQRSDDRAPPKYDAEDAVLQRYRPS